MKPQNSPKIPAALRARAGVKSAFAATVAAGLCASAAFAQGYYPNPNSPIHGTDGIAVALQAIQAKLIAIDPTATLVLPDGSDPNVVIPPDPPSAAEFADALEAAVLDAVNGVGSATLADLIKAGGSYNAAKYLIGAMDDVAVAILNGPGANIEANLETAATVAAGIDPTKASAALSSMLKIVGAKAGSIPAPQPGFADDATSAAIAAAEGVETVNLGGFYADKIITSGVKGVLKAGNGGSDVKAAITAIITDGIATSLSSDLSHLLDEVANSATKAAKTAITGGILTISDVTAAAIAGLGGAPSEDDTATTLAGLLTGHTTNNLKSLATAQADAGVIKAAAAAAGHTGFTDVLVDAWNNQLNGGATTDKTILQTRLNDFFDIAPSPAKSDNAAAALAGAAAAFPNIGPTVLTRTALENDIQYAGADTYENIVRIGVLANQKLATNTAKEAVLTLGGGAITPADLTEVTAGAIAGGRVDIAGLTVGGIFKGTGASNAVNTANVVNTAISSAWGNNQGGAIGDIALNAAKGSKLVIQVAEDAVNAVEALVGEAPSDVALAAAGAVAAASTKDRPAAITAANTAAAALNAASVSQATSILNAIKTSAATGKQFFNLAQQAFNASGKSQDETLSIVYGAGFANSKAASAFASLAVASTAVPASTIADAAVQLNRKGEIGVRLAVATAAQAKASPSTLFDDVTRTIFHNNSKHVADIVTGAVIAQPGYANVVGHAAGFRAPNASAKYVPLLFAYTFRDTTGAIDSKTGVIGTASDDNITDYAAAAAAISAGVTCGILESRQKTTTEANYLKAAIGAAVKAALFFPNTKVELNTVDPTFQQSDGATPSSSTTPGFTRATAGVVTGYLAQELSNASTTTDTTIDAVIGAAVKAAKKHGLEIAQAAGQAIGAITGNAGFGIAALVTAIDAAGAQNNAGADLNPTQISNAISFGIAQGISLVGGAGYVGVSKNGFYNHRTCTGDPVTSIFDL